MAGSCTCILFFGGFTLILIGYVCSKSFKVYAKEAKDEGNDSPSNNKGLGALFSVFKNENQGGTQILNSNKESSNSPGIFSFLAPREASSKGLTKSSSETVFVAGGTGRLGLRIVYELAAAGFKVRAGVRSQEKAEMYQDLLADLSTTLGPLTRQQLSRINVVYCDLEEPESIIPAIGNASKVVCAVGAAENEFTDFSAPQRIDYRATEELVEAAANMGTVEQFVLVSSLGTGKFGFPASVLNLFGGVLYWKRQAEEALEKSGLPYLIVRPGGMERPQDDYKETHNVRLSTRDTLFGGQVSRLQIAELIATALSSPESAENKTVEVVAETKAPLVDYETLLSSQPMEIEQSSRVDILEETKEIRASLMTARQEFNSLLKRQQELREEIKQVTEKAAEARATAIAIEKEEGTVIKQAQKAEAELQRLTEAAEEAAGLEAAAKAVLKESQRAQREGRVLSQEEISSIKESVLNPPQENAPIDEKEPKPATGAFAMFGSLGTQSRTRSPVKETKKEEEIESQETAKSTKNKPSMFDAPVFGAFASKKISDETEKPKIQETASGLPEQADTTEAESVPSTETGKKSEKGGFFQGITNFFQPQGSVYIDELEVAASEKSQIVPEIKNEKPSKSSRPSIRDLRQSSERQVKEQEEPKREDAVEVKEVSKKVVSPERSEKQEKESPVENMFAGVKMPWDQTESVEKVEEKIESPAMNKSTLDSAESSTEEVSVKDNVAEARAWIEAWRARTKAY